MSPRGGCFAPSFDAPDRRLTRTQWPRALWIGCERKTSKCRRQRRPKIQFREGLSIRLRPRPLLCNIIAIISHLRRSISVTKLNAAWLPWMLSGTTVVIISGARNAGRHANLPFELPSKPEKCYRTSHFVVSRIKIVGSCWPGGWCCHDYRVR